jgi:hypothetical protein
VPGVELQLTMAEGKALAQYTQQVEAWGWQVQLQDSAAGAVGADAAAAVAVASGVNSSGVLRQVPMVAGVQLGSFDLQVRCGCFIQQMQLSAMMVWADSWRLACHLASAALHVLQCIVHLHAM